MDQVLSESAGDATARLVERMSFQATACERLGSPLYAHLLRCVATDLEEGGPSREILGGHESDPGGSALALRLMGAVNRLVLTGEEPALDRIYRDTERDEEAAWRAFRSVLKRHPDRLYSLVDRPVQTNEVVLAQPRGPASPDQRGWTLRCPAHRLPSCCRRYRTALAVAGGRSERRAQSELGPIPTTSPISQAGARPTRPS
jgi:hypothetical protein